MESVQGPECLERVKKLRDFAFVHFSDRDSAKAAMEYWDSKYYCSTDMFRNVGDGHSRTFIRSAGCGRLQEGNGCAISLPLIQYSHREACFLCR